MLLKGRTGRVAGLSTRAGTPAVSPPLEEVWPEVGRRLGGFLRRKGVPSQVAEDVVQEVALRVLVRDVQYTDVEDLLPWCLRVASNLVTDLHRASALVSAFEPPERAVPQDLAEGVEQRLRLHQVLGALSGMSYGDQQAIVEAVEGRPTGSSAGERTRRFRARRRLAGLVGAGWALIWGRAGTSDRWVGATTAATTAAFVVVPLLGAPDIGGAVVPAQQLAGRRPAAVAVTQPEGRALPSSAATTHPAPHARAAYPGGSRPSHNDWSAAAPGGALEVSGHDRRDGETGLVCVEDVPLVAHACVG